MSQVATKEAETLQLPNGRTLGYAIYGSPISPDTPVIIYCHGFPGSRIEGARKQLWGTLIFLIWQFRGVINRLGSFKIFGTLF